MHLVAGILLLIIVIIILGLWYFGVITIIITILRILRAIFTTLPGTLYGKRIKEKISFNPLHIFNKRKWIQVVVIFTLLNISLYAYNRSWLMDEHAKYLQAKEYFTAGEVLASHLNFLTAILHPGSLSLKPLFTLEHGIYLLGASHLPKDDAEEALWYYRWFIYPYAKQDLLPKANRYLWILFPQNNHSSLLARILMRDLTIKDIAPKNYRAPQQRFLENTFAIIEKLSTYPISDPNMQREYLKGFPGLAFYYSLNQIYRYNGPAPSARKAMRKETWYTPHNEAQMKWYLAFEKEMNTSQIQKLYSKHLAKNQSLLYGAILNVTEDLILAKIGRMNFTCNGDYMQTYVRVRNLVAGEDGKENGLFFKFSKNEGYWMYDAFIQMPMSKFYKNVARDYCGYIVFGKDTFSNVSEQWQTSTGNTAAGDYLDKLNQQLKSIGEKNESNNQ
ncbi:hypothetical protein [Sulfurimonas sp. HSL3-2]|uniref:hypothetical protein n=1 Tax=Hydrocurvibacter mobilis TaxID=3131936 RepID=UPI0031F9A28C